MKILLIEDEAELAGSISEALVRERFVVDWVPNLLQAREAIHTGKHGLVLLDRTLPEGDGLTLISEMRATHRGIPVIVLSARGEMADRVAGLDRGADDYLTKPFAMEELLARIRAMRRRPIELGPEEISVGRLVFDLATEDVTAGGQRVELSRREIRVLASLLHRRGRTVLRENLEQDVYGFDDDVQSNTLDSHISRVRRKLSDADAGVEIHAIRGVGYLLQACT